MPNDPSNAPVRSLCLRCRRPQSVCWCGQLGSEPTQARVVLLQHPREARVAVGTARMAHLALPNSELHIGVDFEAVPQVRALCDEPGTFLLFPGEGAASPERIDPAQVKRLVVIDGTWPQARKVLKSNPMLQRLPRMGLVPRRPGNYRIRREPAADCLATIEAVVELLGVLERSPERFDALLQAFTWMVDRQLELAAARTTPHRFKRPRQHPELPEKRLLGALERVVAVHVEVNAHARGSDVPGEPEILHIVAERLAERLGRAGERFEAVLAPRRPLAPSAAHHLGLPEETILAGESVAEAQARLAAFLRADDRLCAWGDYPRERLTREGFTTGEWFDLRGIVARRLQGRPGSPEVAAARLGGLAQKAAGGRAERTVTHIGAIVRGLASDRAEA